MKLFFQTGPRPCLVLVLVCARDVGLFKKTYTCIKNPKTYFHILCVIDIVYITKTYEHGALRAYELDFDCLPICYCES